MDSNQARVTIETLALSKVGSQYIAGTKEVIAIEAIYDQILADVLAKFAWGFAQKTVALATLASTPVNFNDGMSIAYAYPEDFLKITLVSEPNASYRQEAGMIVSDTSGLCIKYTFLNDDPTTYTPDFINAFAARLAFEICEIVSENANKKVALKAEYDEALQEAMSSDSQGSSPVQMIQDEWENARLSGASSVPGLPGSMNVGF